MSNLEIFLKYLETRPLILKLMDVFMIMVVVFTIGATYILATNFKSLFMNQDQIEYELFINAAETNNKINTILEELRSEVKASRVGVFQFHNGTTGIGAMPFFFYTQTFEKIARGVSSELQNNQRISMTIDPDIITLKKEGFGEYRDIDSSTTFGHTLSSRGTRHMFRHAIYSLSGEFIGFLTVEYSTLEDVPSDVDYIREIMDRYAGAITAFLNTPD